MPTPAPARPPLLERLGRFTVRRRFLLLAVGALATVLTGVLGAGALDALSLSRIDAPGSESDRARTLLAERFHTGPPNLALLVTAHHGTVDDPAVRTAGERLGRALAAEPGVSEVVSYWPDRSNPALRSTDATRALVLARVPGDVNESRARVGEIAREYTGDRASVRVQAGGQDEVFREIGAQSRRDFLRAEAVIIPLVLLLLVLYYRGIVLALVTLGVGVFAIAGSLTALRGIAGVTNVSTFAANIALVMGLALGVDYCLFLVGRFREELAAGRDVAGAVVTAVGTAGRTILFSGLTVAVSLLALLLFPLSFLRSFGYAGAAVVAAAVLGALVFLPAILATLGHRAAGRARSPRTGSGGWFRLARLVMRRPALLGGSLLVVVLVLAAPALGLRFGMPDARILPEGSPSRATADVIRAEFAQEQSDAVYLVAPRSGGTDAVAAYAAELSAVDGITQVDSAAGSFTSGIRIAAPPPAGAYTADGGTFLTAIPSQRALAGDPADLVDRIRAVPAPFPVLVGGAPAETADWRAAMTERLPLVLAVVLLLTFAILFLMTGSLLLPVKATVLNLLSMAVMFGALVWIFQDGNLSGALGFSATGTLESSVPVLMFCIVYGLSMDYEVFIVSRIREEYLRTGDARLAVPAGLQRGAPLVTTAAVILAASFAVYALGGVVYLKMIGVGMAVAVLVDALLIRGVLLPAFMRLAGSANWWAPAPLRRLHARWGITEAAVPPRLTAPTA
ncbi:RND superfamily putative drug exporter [Prauserella shujinwangii]|uniref:RND superfamily putative drug exporter n=1 Tax=Prauserella shujinwangii TaxID=1453103 RepID=A0A2T0LPD1_9PSEU|nr:MMPL family transporter [Prauserella shujinwangii]PRX45120.1 RND superfamily putative drug exporter [Prauserella shujinwangii]